MCVCVWFFFSGGGANGNGRMEVEEEGGKAVERISTREWAERHEYNPHKLFLKVSESSQTSLI